MDNRSPVGIMPCAGSLKCDWVRTASSSWQIEGLVRLKAARLCPYIRGVSLSKSVGGVCRVA